MGKQVNFYMTEPDEAEFMKFVRLDRNVRIILGEARTEAASIVAELPERSKAFWWGVWLWDQDNSPMPSFRYVPRQRYYIVDDLASEVIQFHRSRFDGDRLVRGRIWAEMTVWDRDGARREKSASFRKWFDRLASWIKRSSGRDHAGDYVLPGAAEVANRGGTLTQAVVAKTVKLFRHDVGQTE